MPVGIEQYLRKMIISVEYVIKTCLVNILNMYVGPDTPNKYLYVFQDITDAVKRCILCLSISIH